MDYTSILAQARHYIQSLFESHANGKLHYHNWEHTEKVAEAAAMIGQHYQLNDLDFFIVNMAGWFHDIGYLTGEVAGHEERGARMADAFMTGIGVDAGVIASVRQCILATQIPQRPAGLLDEIVCDADLFHLGTDLFVERNKLMRKEVEAVGHRKIGKDRWRRDTIRFMEAHHYYTDYCRLLLDEKKHENLMRLKIKEAEEEREAAREEVRVAMQGAARHKGNAGKDGSSDNAGKGANPIANLLHEYKVTPVEEEHPMEEKEKKNKKKDPGRGIDTVFRITSNNNQKLSSQADSKAHILIQVNSIIISVLLSLLLRKIEDHANLAIPSIILLTVNLVTIIFSILATRPHIPPGTFNHADLEQKKVNLLFFGNFYRMSLEEYAGGMLQMMDDKDFLYGSLIRDVYSQGIALGKKYRWLRLSYNVFMYGLIASVLAFVVAALAFQPKS